jgi:hypothetical protein
MPDIRGFPHSFMICAPRVVLFHDNWLTVVFNFDDPGHAGLVIHCDQGCRRDQRNTRTPSAIRLRPITARDPCEPNNSLTSARSWGAVRRLAERRQLSTSPI